MNLTDTGTSRVNGYLFVLERSLKTFLPSDATRDAVREIESHLRERIAASDGAPNERDALEQILAELGPPLRVAQAYAAERTLDEAVATGRVVPMVRALWHLAVSTLAGFAAAFAVIVGTLWGIGLVAIGIAKVFFPENVGFFFRRNAVVPHAFGAIFPVPPGDRVAGGYWIVPFSLVGGLVIVVLTYRGARRFLTWWRERRVS